MADDQSRRVTQRGARYHRRMADAQTEGDRAYAEWQALRADARHAPPALAEAVYAQLIPALRAARNQLTPRRNP